MYDRNRVCIIIPAFNEEKTILDAITRAKNYGVVIVVDDGSKDATRLMAMKAGVDVVSHSRNLGYSAALRTGYLHSTKEVITILDADMQQVPEEVPKLVSPIMEGKADMVIGSKFKGRLEYRPNIPNLVMDKSVCLIMRLRYGIKLSNSFSGFRALRKSCIDLDFLSGDRHTAMVELDFLFAQRRHRIIEVPRTAKKRKYGKSSVRFKDGLAISKRVMELLVRKDKETSANSSESESSQKFNGPQGERVESAA